MRAHVLLVVAALVACKKDKAADDKANPTAAPPTSTAAQDALWALAPDGAIVGAVVSPNALSRLEGGWAEVSKVLASPDLAPFKAQVDEGLAEVFGTSSASLAAAGMTAQKGLAVFAVAGEKPIMILPVADRDKFVAIAKGTKGTDSDTIKNTTCKTVKAVYACARNVALLDRLGKGNMTALLKLAGARGDVEFAATIPGQQIEVGAVAQIGRGTAVIRAGAKGLPADAVSLMANTKPRTDGDKTAGFALLNVAPILAKFADKVPPLPIVSGVAADELVKTVTGPITMTIGNGATVIDLRIPLGDGAIAQKLVEQCDKIPNANLLGVTVKDGACHVPLPQMAMDVDAWVDGKTLRIGKQGAQDAYPSTTMSPIAKELADGEWTAVAFGRGTIIAPSQMRLPVPPGPLPPEAMLGLRGISMLNEIGFGIRKDGDVVRAIASVRTAWANPDDVVAKLVAITPDQWLGGKAGDLGKSIAESSPNAPFAADYKTGYGGLMVPTAMVGMLAAVAIPAFLDYTKKPKRSEALLQLNKLEKSLKIAFIENAEFPKGTVALTPAKPCCEGPSHKCAPDAWTDPVWQGLEFRIDEPHLFRYSYDSKDGKTFVAKAVGDLDCDGVEIEYVLNGRIENGAPVIDLVEPAPNSD